MTKLDASVLNREQTAKYRKGEQVLAQANDRARWEAQTRYNLACQALLKAYEAEKVSIDVQYVTGVEALLLVIA